MPDHVHMCIAIPPKHPVSSVIGFLKGKSAIAIARLCGKERNFSGEHFWARGYAVCTVGFELESANTSASKKPRMDKTDSSELLIQARFSATPKLTALRGVSDWNSTRCVTFQWVMIQLTASSTSMAVCVHSSGAATLAVKPCAASSGIGTAP